MLFTKVAVAVAVAVAVPPSDLKEQGIFQAKPKPHQMDRPISYADVVGFTEIKKRMDEIFKSPKSAPESKSQLGFLEKKNKCGAILFFGPCGVGKTHFVESLALEYKVPYFLMRPSDILSSWEGQSERNIVQFLCAAKEAAAESDSGKAIISMDFADVLLGKNYQEISIQNALIWAIGECGPDVLWISTTDRPDYFDPKFLYLFPEKIFMPLPDPGIRRLVLERKFELQKTKVDQHFLKAIIDATHMFSFRELKFFLQDADSIRAKKLLSATHWKKVQVEGVELEWEMANPGDPEAVAVRFKDMDESLRSSVRLPLLSQEEIGKALNGVGPITEKELVICLDFEFLHNGYSNHLRYVHECELEHQTTRLARAQNPSNDNYHDDGMAEEENNCFPFWDFLGLCI